MGTRSGDGGKPGKTGLNGRFGKKGSIFINQPHGRHDTVKINTIKRETKNGKNGENVKKLTQN